MSVDRKLLAERYCEIFQDFLRDNGESSLTSGYEFARQAMADGCSMLELTEFHHEALRRVIGQQEGVDRLLTQAAGFLSECLSPYEMSHRGAQEGSKAMRRLNELLEGELKRIAHALHDEAGQLLASVHIALSDIASELPAGFHQRFEEVGRLLKQIEVELRNLSHELRPTVLDNLGLIPALEMLAEKISKRTGLAVSVAGDIDSRLPPAVETALYRIVQEALNNAVKHAKAKTVSIELERRPLRIESVVRENGSGIDSRRRSN